MSRLKVIQCGGKCHMINNIKDSRMLYNDFKQLIGYLRKQFRNHLTYGYYNDQPVYEYRTNAQDLMQAINKYNNNITIDLEIK